jgi:hypothetical protein
MATRLYVKIALYTLIHFAALQILHYWYDAISVGGYLKNASLFMSGLVLTVPFFTITGAYLLIRTIRKAF